jgi:hypothetical protein
MSDTIGAVIVGPNDGTRIEGTGWQPGTCFRHRARISLASITTLPCAETGGGGSVGCGYHA